MLHSVPVHASCRRFPFVLSLSAFVCLSKNVNVVVYVLRVCADSWLQVNASLTLLHFTLFIPSVSRYV
jgi:hypothetical protein